jgi:hypothetical protein
MISSSKQVLGLAVGSVVLESLGPLSRLAEAQCAMCRTGLLNSEEGRMLIGGFNSGILLLLAVPILIFAFVLFQLWRATRRQSSGRRPSRKILSNDQSRARFEPFS